MDYLLPHNKIHTSFTSTFMPFMLFPDPAKLCSLLKITARSPAEAVDKTSAGAPAICKGTTSAGR